MSSSCAGFFWFGLHQWFKGRSFYDQELVLTSRNTVINWAWTAVNFGCRPGRDSDVRVTSTDGGSDGARGWPDVHFLDLVLLTHVNLVSWIRLSSHSDCSDECSDKSVLGFLGGLPGLFVLGGLPLHLLWSLRGSWCSGRMIFFLLPTKLST